MLYPEVSLLDVSGPSWLTCVIFVTGVCANAYLVWSTTRPRFAVKWETFRLILRYTSAMDSVVRSAVMLGGTIYRKRHGVICAMQTLRQRRCVHLRLSRSRIRRHGRYSTDDHVVYVQTGSCATASEPHARGETAPRCRYCRLRERLCCTTTGYFHALLCFATVLRCRGLFLQRNIAIPCANRGQFRPRRSCRRAIT